MHPVKFPQSNAQLVPPVTMSAEECGVLPVRMDPEAGFTISCWEPTDAEIEELKATKKLWVYVWTGGISQPPIAIATQDPFRGMTCRPMGK
jgi:hypothetical protein